MNKITTKQGDMGLTTLIGHARVEKTDVRIEAIGEIDELMSVLGMLKACPLLLADIYSRVERIQNTLMTVMKHIATSGTDTPDNLQTEIDYMEQFMNKVCNDRNFTFVLPGSSPAEALAQMARAKARTAERRMCIVNGQIKLSPTVMAYINRLSDYLFVIASLL